MEMQTLADAKKEQEQVQEQEVQEEETQETQETEETEVSEKTEETQESEEESQDIEPWQATEDDQTSDGIMPVKSHVRVKRKLKGKISEQSDEISKLKTEIEALKQTPATKTGPPKEEDFDDWDSYNRAKEAHDAERIRNLVTETAKQREIESKQAKLLEKRKQAVDEHYTRASELIEKSGIDPERYKQADQQVRNIIEAVMPTQGDTVTDHMISTIGQGSEKVMYFLGNNKSAGLELQSLLLEDQSGLKAAIYIGKINERLNNPTKRTSNASKPAPVAKGDAVINSGDKALKKKYDEAWKKGNPQEAYNAKRAAKKAGVDVSGW